MLFNKDFRIPINIQYKDHYNNTVTQVPYPVVTIKEVNKLFTWQMVLMCIGAFAIVYSIYRIYLYIKKKVKLWR